VHFDVGERTVLTVKERKGRTLLRRILDAHHAREEPLRVQVDGERAMPAQAERGSQVQGRGRLARPALVITDDNPMHRAVFVRMKSNYRVSLGLRFCCL
jgi:hypothetical protein